ncbi:MAG: sulfatase-like hydrolase/transferase [Planctomycetota bacterium]
MHIARALPFCLLLTGAQLVAQDQATTTAAAPKRPHVIVIVSDDAGYADFSVHGARDIETPRIDSIAEGGVRCTQGYVSGSVCSPTRAGLMTGRYQQRFGHEKNIPPQWSEENGLPLDERTFADDMLAAGYGTVALGKWHLGYADHFHPQSRGFEHYYGFLQGQRSYFPLERVTRLNRLLKDRDVAPESFDYMTDELGRAAAKFIAERGDRPLFLYLAFNAVHGPMHATEQDLVGTKGPQRRRKLIAMTHALDRAVGYVLDALDEQGIADDTLLFFVNDNGGATNNASENTPLRGHKGQVFEGGIRVPFLVRWPAGLPKGAVYEQPVIALDILPTSLAAADAAHGGDKALDAKPLDGVDLLPFLRGEQQGAPHEALFWKMGDTWAVRCGDHKLVHQQEGAPMLFDVQHDVAEATDLAAAQPEKVTALRARYDAWAKELMKPRWGNGKGEDD